MGAIRSGYFGPTALATGILGQRTAASERSTADERPSSIDACGRVIRDAGLPIEVRCATRRAAYPPGGASAQRNDLDPPARRALSKGCLPVARGLAVHRDIEVDSAGG